jgi:FkbM family methyltransferase
MLEAFEAKLVEKYCRPGMQVVDVGANIGFYTLIFSRLVGETGHVWAFEPAPGNAEILRKNIAVNRFSNISIVEAGVSNTTEDGNLYISDSHQGDHRTFSQEDRDTLSIKLYALDDYFQSKQRIDLIKLDIQGAEGLALMGMRRILANNPGLIILMEFWPDMLLKLGLSPKEMLQDLLNLGYRIQVIDEKRQTLYELTEPNKLIKSLVDSRIHTNLFAMLPS